MSILQTARDVLEVNGVAFVPLREDRKAAPRPPTDLAAFPLLNRFLAECGWPLKELARRARRLGPLDGGAVVLVTGSRPGVGCSTFALALAAAAAAERPVVLIDADLAEPDLSAQLAGESRPGWEQDLQALWAAGFQPRPSDRPGTLAFLPLQRGVADPEALLAQPALPPWLAQLRDGYDLVVLDGGPARDNGVRWAPWADLAVLVCDSRQPGPDWAQAWDRLEEAGTHVLGIVEMFAEKAAAASPPPSASKP